MARKTRKKKPIVFIEICGGCYREIEVTAPLNPVGNKCKVCGSIMHLDGVKDWRSYATENH